MQKKISTSLVASLLLATTNLYSTQSLETITGKAYYKAFSNMIFEKWKIKI